MGKVCAIGALCSGCGKQPVPGMLQPHRQQIKNGKETEKNEKIKYIKDLAAGGVLFASLIALTVGILIFVHHLF